MRVVPRVPQVSIPRKRGAQGNSREDAYQQADFISFEV